MRASGARVCRELALRRCTILALIGRQLILDLIQPVAVQSCQRDVVIDKHHQARRGGRQVPVSPSWRRLSFWDPAGSLPPMQTVAPRDLPSGPAGSSARRGVQVRYASSSSCRDQQIARLPCLKAVATLPVNSDPVISDGHSVRTWAIITRALN